MKIFADLHIHSRFSRATSKEINLKNLSKYAKIKGLNLLGCGDFTHPVWFKELKESLNPLGNGIYEYDGTYFILTSEVSSVYEQEGKTRKIHNLILSPSFEIVEQINDFFLKRGYDLGSDGRLTIDIPCPELVEKIKEIDNKNEIIPCHIWTPWFSLFGSNSGFNSVKECFQDQEKHIFALETGLSSDPEMNWRLSQLDKYILVSNSDSHSYYPWRIGREANVFDCDLDYNEIIKAMKEKNSKKFLFTIEVDPSYGKYHFDGHRKCGVRLSPKEALKLNNICPVCRRKLTIGVLHRVEELADREEGFVPKKAIPFKSLIPLSEIISHVLNTNDLYSRKVWEEYNKLINIGPEFEILLNTPKEKLLEITKKEIAELIIKIREGEVKIIPGYDGVYGKLVLNGKGDLEKSPQKTLRSFIS